MLPGAGGHWGYPSSIPIPSQFQSNSIPIPSQFYPNSIHIPSQFHPHSIPIPSVPVQTEGVVTHVCKFLVFSFNLLDVYFFKSLYSTKLTLNVTFPWI